MPVTAEAWSRGLSCHGLSMADALIPTPGSSPYELLGGEPVLRKLVKRFYELMDTLPEAYRIRQLHPTDLSGSEQKLFWFLSGWLGGPQLYIERFGHPRLRARHLPFAIGNDEVIQWMHCMTQAINEVIRGSQAQDWLEGQLNQLASHMRNRDEPTG